MHGYILVYLYVLNQPQWFQQWFEQTVDQFNTYFPRSITNPLSTEFCVDYDQLDSSGSTTHQIAMVQLNGGLGTSMGCDGPKSLIECDSTGRSFLDVIIQQYQSTPSATELILLNSFHTSKQTTDYLTQSYPDLSFRAVTQYPFNRIDATTNQPCYPHRLIHLGMDRFTLICIRGELHRLMDRNIDYLSFQMPII